MLGDLVDITSGYAFKSKLFNQEGEGKPIIRIRDVGKDKTETFYSGEYKEDFVVRNGDYLIGMDGDFRLAEWQGGEALLNQRVCKIAAKENLILPRFLFHLLPRELKRIEDSTSFATVKHLSVKKINQIKIPLPPLEQQKKIAEILDTADEYRQKTKALLDKYDELAQSIFMDMYGEEKGYEILELGKVIKLLGGGTPSKKVDEYWNGDIPWVSVKDLKSDRIKKTIDLITIEGVKNSATRILPENSLIVATRLANGKAVICEVPMAINQDLKGIKIIGDANVIFLQYLFKSKQNYLESIASGATVKGIKIEDITKIKTPIPPIEVQNDFADKINSIEEQKRILKSSELKSSELFNSLLQKAFKGKLV